MADLALPSTDVGPVLLSEFCRLASSFLSLMPGSGSILVHLIGVPLGGGARQRDAGVSPSSSSRREGPVFRKKPEPVGHPTACRIPVVRPRTERNSVPYDWVAGAKGSAVHRAPVRRPLPPWH